MGYTLPQQLCVVFRASNGRVVDEERVDLHIDWRRSIADILVDVWEAAQPVFLT